MSKTKKEVVKAPNPWSEWYRYYDPRPVPYPKMCKENHNIIVHNKQEESDFYRKHISVSNLRTFPTFLDSDVWMRVPGWQYKEPLEHWEPYKPQPDDISWKCGCEECSRYEGAE
jgi:hypothetical protein